MRKHLLPAKWILPVLLVAPGLANGAILAAGTSLSPGAIATPAAATFGPALAGGVAMPAALDPPIGYAAAADGCVPKSIGGSRSADAPPRFNPSFRFSHPSVAAQSPAPLFVFKAGPDSKPGDRRASDVAATGPSERTSGKSSEKTYLFTFAPPARRSVPAPADAEQAAQPLPHWNATASAGDAIAVSCPPRDERAALPADLSLTTSNIADATWEYSLALPSFQPLEFLPTRSVAAAAAAALLARADIQFVSRKESPGSTQTRILSAMASSQAPWDIGVRISDFGDPVPEPGTLALLGSGLLGMVLVRRRTPIGS